MNNQTKMNKIFPHQKYPQQRKRYKSNERINFSPNNNINNINIIRNQNQKYNYKNNNINYINQKNNNQFISSQNIATLKQMKSKQNNQIYLEGDLNNFINNQNNIYSYSNINKGKNKNMNNIQRISNANKIKNKKGIPRKSPIPIPNSFITGKYINNDNMSYISKNSNKSNASNNGSYYTVNSQLLNNNYSISNLSKISGISNNSFNNNNYLINYGAIVDNEHQRAYSNNISSSMNQKQINDDYYKYNNKTSIRNKFSNNNLNIQASHISEYTHKVTKNNYINNNNILNKLITQNGMKKPNINRSPNPTRKDYLSYTIKRNNNNNLNENNYNIINKNNLINNNNIINNESLLNKIGNRTSSNFISNYNNVNEYYNYEKENDIAFKNNVNYNGRPLTSYSHNNKNRNNNNKNNKMIMSNQFRYNSKDINLNNYNSNEINQRNNIFLNNKNNNNYIRQYNSNNIKRDYSANNPNNRINIGRFNNDYTNNFNNINPMFNLHIINKGQIINNNYNNINSMNNNMNNLYVYKYDISQNNNFQGQYNTNTKKHSNNNIRNNKNSLMNNDNMNKINRVINDEMNNNYIINKNTQNLHNYNEKGVKMRSNSSSGIEMTGELNNILNQRNNDKINHNLINKKNLDLNKTRKMNNNINNNNNRSQILNNNINITRMKSPHKKIIIKQIRKIHHFTHVGFNGERDKEFNQDIAFLEKNFAGNNSYLYFAVCDGHGIEGHEVSSFIKRILPKELSKSLNNKDLLTNDKNVKKKIYNIIGQTFIKVNERLISNELINSIFSGTTCVSVIYTPIKIICANIGDSRAVLGRFDKNSKKWLAINLSRDHKPTEEDEARRIYKKGGRIKPYIDMETGEEVGPQRVWVKDDDVPGLAMTRSFGDRVAAIAGTICIPEIKEYNFHEDDKFLILASDGVWEFIQSQECINIIGKFYLNNNIEGCCEFLYNESRKRWIKEEETVDDITILLAFFD